MPVTRKQKQTKKVVEEKPESPVIDAFAIEQGKDGWFWSIYKIQDGKIIDKQAGVPNIRAIVNEQFRIALADRYFK